MATDAHGVFSSSAILKAPVQSRDNALRLQGTVCLLLFFSSLSLPGRVNYMCTGSTREFCERRKTTPEC
jgi:hypothetical protein